MIKAIIFDCFGVLTSDGWLPFAEKYFGHDRTLKDQARDLNKQVDSGLISYDSFVEQVALMAAVDLSEAYRAIDNNVPNDELFGYIEHLKKHYKIGLLSNAGANWLNELFAPEQVALFDAVALSFEMGVTKPHESAYEVICKRLGISPKEAVFVDDIERYVTGARDIGMKGIWYKDVAQLRRELDALLANSNM